MIRILNLALRAAGTKRAGVARYINIEQKANKIVNAAIVNNCENVRISKATTAIVKHEIKGNQMKVWVPAQVPMDRLVFHIEGQLRDQKGVKVEVVGHDAPRRKKFIPGYKIPKNARPVLKSKKGWDDGTGTGGRHGIRGKRWKG